MAARNRNISLGDLKVAFDYKGKVFPIVEPEIVKVKELSSKISS